MQKGRLLLSGLTLSGAFALPSTSLAAVTQPDGVTVVPVPQEQSTDYFDPNRYNVNTLGLQSLMDSREGPGVIDIQTDAATEPAVFSPLCNLRGTMILRGGSCLVDFGWYCVDTPTNIHPLVTQADILHYHDVLLPTFQVELGPPPPPLNNWTEYQNDEKGFVPTIQMPPLEGSSGLADVRAHPDFALDVCPSQQISFAVIGNPSSYCPQTKYAQQHLNEVCTLPACNGQSWISALIYPSRSIFGGFYIAVEDLPTLPNTFSPLLTALKDYYPNMKQPTGWDGSNDGDFNDFVYFVSGIQCIGGGQPCKVPGGLGICSAGVTECSETEGVEGECRPTISPETEVCDDLDNDCDGAVDEDTCPPKQICVNGNCIAGCSPTEFPCAEPLVCEIEGEAAGYCVDPACVGFECPPGSVCRQGECYGGCEGVVCPGDQECVLGRCVDLCAGVQCEGDFVCLRGVCVSSCQCAGCLDGKVCTPSGECVEPGCESQTCSDGQICRQGKCVDACEGVVCPFSMPCANGECPPPDPTNPGVIPPNSGGEDGLSGPGDGLSGPSGGSTGANGASGANGIAGPQEPGCGCRVTATAPMGRGGFGALLLGVALGLSRRRLRVSSSPRSASS